MMVKMMRAAVVIAHHQRIMNLRPMRRKHHAVGVVLSVETKGVKTRARCIEVSEGVGVVVVVDEGVPRSDDGVGGVPSGNQKR